MRCYALAARRKYPRAKVQLQKRARAEHGDGLGREEEANMAKMTSGRYLPRVVQPDRLMQLCRQNCAEYGAGIMQLQKCKMRSAHGPCAVTLPWCHAHNFLPDVRGVCGVAMSVEWSGADWSSLDS